MNMQSRPPFAETAPPPVRPKVSIFLLALVTLCGTMAMHVFVPALPAAGADLGASASAMQMTVSLYIAGLAVGQLFYGPISDRLGRRPVLMAGIALFTLASVAALLAPGIDTLLAARLFQALGGCAGLVLGRAIVRDVSGDEDTARRMALMNLMVLLGPGVAPLIGGALTAAAGWRSIFVLLSLLGFAVLLLVWKAIPETGRGSRVMTVGEIRREYLKLLGSRRFISYALGGGCATTSMYAFIAAAPFVFTHELHRPVEETGIYLSVLIFGAWFGSMIASRLIGRVAIPRLLITANLVSFLGALLLTAIVLTDQLSVWAVIACLLLFTLGAGSSSPIAMSLAVSVNPKVVGSASGLYGSTQMFVGASCTALSGIGADPALSAALVLVGASVVAQTCFWTAERGRG